MRYQFLFVATLLLVGCEPPTPKAKIVPAGKSGGGQVIVGSSGAGPATVASPLTDDQKRQFVDSVLSVVGASDLDGSIVDTHALFTKVADIVEVPQSQRAKLIQGATEGYSKNKLEKMIIDQTQNGGSFSFLHYSTRDGVETAIFRLLYADFTINYVEFALPSSSASNRTLAPDVYTYSAAEWLSRASAQISLQIKASEDRSVLGKLFNGASFGASDGQKCADMMKKINRKDYAGAVAAFHALPATMKQTKICLMLRHNAAQLAQDETDRLSSIEEMRKYFRDDPGVAFLSIDLYLSRKEFGKAMSGIDTLERAVGGDPFLDALRGSINLEANDMDAAIAMARKAAASDIHFELAHWVIARASMAKGEFATTTAALRNLQSIGRATPENIAATPEFAPYVASTEFQTWQSGK